MFRNKLAIGDDVRNALMASLLSSSLGLALRRASRTRVRGLLSASSHSSAPAFVWASQTHHRPPLSRSYFAAAPSAAESLRRLESAANRAPHSARAQEEYLAALLAAGLGGEVQARCESGRFAASPAALDLYARGLVDARRLREADAPEARARLRALLQQQAQAGAAGAPLSGDAVRFAALGGGGGGSGGFGGYGGAGAGLAEPFASFGGGGYDTCVRLQQGRRFLAAAQLVEEVG